MEVRKIPLNKIKQVDNSRNKIKKHELEQLMSSIKKDGLLQPIGVRPILNTDEFEVNFGNRRFLAFQKLGFTEIDCNVLDEAELESDVLITNLIENEHRSSISDIEKGRYYLHLLSDEFGLTLGELAIRIGISKEKIRQCIRLHKDIPEYLRSKVSTAKNSNAKGGTIPVSLADIVLTKGKMLGLKQKQIEDILEHCRVDGVTKAKINSVINLISAGATVKKAIEATQDVRIVTVSLPVKNDDYEFYQKELGSANAIREAICKTLYGLEDNEVTFQKPY